MLSTGHFQKAFILSGLLFLGLSILVIPFNSRADIAPASSVDFVRNQIWFSKQPFYSGDQIKIYTSIFNSGPADTRGTVEFYGNQKLLGHSDFSLVAGSAQIVWTSWKADLGTYNFYAKMASVKAVYPDGREEKIADSINELPIPISVLALPKNEFISNDLITPSSHSPSIVASVLGRFDLGTTTATTTLAQLLLHVINKVAVNFDATLDNTKIALEGIKTDVGRKINTATPSTAGSSLKSENVKNSDQSKSTTPSDSTRGPFQVFYYYFLSAFTFLLAFKSLIYLILLYGFYRFVRFLIRRPRDERP